jgi:ATP-dependent DNA helicase UvrD/PcrA
VRRLLGVDAEVRAARPVPAGWSGTEHLDAFGDVVGDFSTRRGATVSALLAFLDTAEQVENGLAPAEITVTTDRVQILTVHAAKGLEWQIVAVPHLSGRVFPSTASPRTWLSDAADLPPLLRGDCATVSEHGVPVLDTATVNDRKALSNSISDHKRSLDQRRTDEERRLLYVAITRAESTLLVSGHHWGATESKPRGPSTFLCELKDVIDASAAAGTPCGVIDVWADAPADGEPNPLRDRVVEAMWPTDPVAGRRESTDRGAELVAQAMSADTQDDTQDDAFDVHGWAADVDALLAERRTAARRPTPSLPTQLSVSTVVELGRDPGAVAQRLNRRLPRHPDSQALLGTAFHEWVQRYFQAEKLFDLDDLPGAVDADRQDRGELEELQAAFAVSAWAARTPLEVEVPFDMVIAGRVVRGRIDAVFADEDGAVTVVDWKTGEPPSTPEDLQRNAVQLAIYRLAWARLQGCPVSSVRAAFHYVRSGRTVVPDVLLGADEVAELMTLPAA